RAEPRTLGRGIRLGADPNVVLGGVDVDGFHHLARLVGERNLLLLRGGCGGGHDVFSLRSCCDVQGGATRAVKPKALKYLAAPGPEALTTPIAPPGNFAIEATHAGAAGPSFGAQKILNGASEGLGLVEVGNMPGAGKLHVTRAGQRVVELAHGRR